MSSNYADRLHLLNKHVPSIFSSRGTVLYVGAKIGRMDYIPEIFSAGNEITVLEAFEPNAEDIRGCELIHNVVCGDMRDIGVIKLPHDTYSFSFIWHGIEHLRYSEALDVVGRVEKITKRCVILGTPWGYVPQGQVGGNSYEEHKSFWTPEMFRDIGYSAVKIGEEDVLGSCILAWKETCSA